ncbi:MAG: sigma-70 family RNA polymerase sigma factor [Bacteroidota bacterium]
MKKEFLEEVYPHQHLIHKICHLYRDHQEDKEDLFQEILYQLWKAYPSFRGNSKITTWMYRIGLNTAMASFRKRKPDISNSLDQMGETISEEEVGDALSEQLKQAIKLLNEGDRALVALYLDDLSYMEMAEILGITENHVGVKLTRIREKLKKIIVKV